MNIIVCIKQVPDVLNIRMDRKRMTIIREGVKSIINPLDYVALEAGLDLREREGGTVTVLTMGPPQSEEALREAMAAGADKGILLTDKEFAGSDTLATSHVIATAIQRLENFPDLVLCGVQTIDSDTGHVGPQIAEELDIPQVCGVNDIHKEGEYLIVKRQRDGLQDTIRVELPALLAVNSDLISVGHLPLGAVETAFSGGEIIKWGMRDLELSKKDVGFNGSATRVLKLHAPETKRECEILIESSQKLAERIIHKLEELSILDDE